MRRRILWLCSWYPGRMEPFNGDFIQRQAQAAALFDDIYVIHVYGDPGRSIRKRITEIRQHDHLTEHLVYFPKGNGSASRMINGYKWLLYTRQAVRQYIRTSGRPDLVHVQVPMKAGIFGQNLKRRFGIPLVVSEHWGIYNDLVQDGFSRRSATFRRYTRNFFDAADIAVSPSRFLADGVDRLVIKKEWKIIPNVVNTGLFHHSLVPGTRPFRFIHVSNMVELKDPGGILRAFRKVAERESAELIMVGNKDQQLAGFAAELGIGDKVHFRGEIPYEAVASEMKSADAFVLFSRMENSPCVIGEALCCGLPVIATATGGIPELVSNSNGILVNPGDVDGLYDAMVTVIKNYENFDRTSISKEAAAKYAYPVVGRQFHQLYEGLLIRT